jgi:hypothetical protein
MPIAARAAAISIVLVAPTAVVYHMPALFTTIGNAPKMMHRIPGHLRISIGAVCRWCQQDRRRVRRGPRAPGTTTPAGSLSARSRHRINNRAASDESAQHARMPTVPVRRDVTVDEGARSVLARWPGPRHGALS